MFIKNPAFLLIIVSLFSLGHSSLTYSQEQKPDISDRLASIFFLPQELWDSSFDRLSDDWDRAYTPMAIEMMSLSRAEMGYRFLDLLKQKSGEEEQQ